MREFTRFFRYHSSMIGIAPLQLYTSALLFTPTGSIGRKNFKENIPNWVFMKPIIQHWSPSLNLLIGHQSFIRDIHWAPDGIHLVSFTDDSIKFWDLKGNHCVLSFDQIHRT